MTAQELKNSILQYAVQGKLVPQDPTDEPASVLLERIKSEKAQLIKDKKIKAEKPLAPITEDEIPFEIPDNWVWVKMNEILNIYTGNSINETEKQKKYTNLELGRSYIATKDVQFNNSIIYENGIKIPFNLLDFKVAYCSSTLMCIEGGSAGRKIAFLEEDVCFGNKLCCFQPILFNSKYIYYYLQNPLFLDVFKSSINGIIGGVSVNRLKDLIIPLPPLTEQQRIVAKIEELMPLVEEYDKAEKELTDLNAKFPEQIKKSVLQYAIQGKLVAQSEGDEPASELLKRIKAEKQQLIKDKKIKAEKPLPPITDEEIPFEIPESWVWCRLGEIVTILGDGIHGTPIYDNDGDYFFINGNNLDNGSIVIKSSTKRINFKEYQKHKKELNERSILVSINGTLGNIAFYNGENVILGKSACFFNLCVPLNMKFIKTIINSSHFEKYAISNATQTTIQNVSLKSMRELLIPLPPLSEQQRIVEKVEEVLGVCEGLKA